MKEFLTQMQEAKKKEAVFCPYGADHIEKLIGHMQESVLATNNVAHEVRELGSSVQTLNAHHKDIIRYLMIVVCVIALGKSLLEAVQVFVGRSAHAEAAK